MEEGILYAIKYNGRWTGVFDTYRRFDKKCPYILRDCVEEAHLSGDKDATAKIKVFEIKLSAIKTIKLNAHRSKKIIKDSEKEN